MTTDFPTAVWGVYLSRHLESDTSLFKDILIISNSEEFALKGLCMVEMNLCVQEKHTCTSERLILFC